MPMRLSDVPYDGVFVMTPTFTGRRWQRCGHTDLCVKLTAEGLPSDITAHQPLRRYVLMAPLGAGVVMSEDDVRAFEAAHPDHREDSHWT